MKGQDARGLLFGDLPLEHPPALDRDITDLVEKGVPVYYVREDLEERGIPEARLIDGIKPVSRKELPGMLDGFELVWHW